MAVCVTFAFGVAGFKSTNVTPEGVARAVMSTPLNVVTGTETVLLLDVALEPEEEPGPSTIRYSMIRCRTDLSLRLTDGGRVDHAEFTGARKVIIEEELVNKAESPVVRTYAAVVVRFGFVDNVPIIVSVHVGVTFAGFSVTGGTEDELGDFIGGTGGGPGAGAGGGVGAGAGAGAGAGTGAGDPFTVNCTDVGYVPAAAAGIALLQNMFEKKW